MPAHCRKISVARIGDLSIGHAQNQEAATGCTVLLCPQGAVAGVDVRGGAPGTRETDLLSPVNLVEQVHAILLAGGSAYGLDAATGVMRWLEEQGAGFDVQVAKVPIVSGAVLFDLPVGNARIRPDADMGYAACLAATRKAPATGNVGAGTGASVGKAAGMERAMKGGLGCCGLQAGGLKVGAVIAVNCLGDVLDPMTGKILAGTLSADRQHFAGSDNVLLQSIEHPVNLLTSNTTIGAVFTNAGLSKSQATKLASMAQCGLVRSIRPAHTMYDGDTIFALSLGETAADLNVLGVLAARAVELAVLNAVQAAKSLAGLACARDFQPR